MKHLGTLAALTLCTALTGAALGAAKAPAKPPAPKQAEPPPVAEPLRWKAKDDAPAWVHENVARYLKERTTTLPVRWTALLRFRKEVAAKGDAESKRQLAIGEKQFANLLSGDGIPPVYYSVAMDPKEYQGNGPAYGACFVTFVKVLGPDKALCDVIVGARASGNLGQRKPMGDVSSLPTVRAVVQHEIEFGSLGKFFRAGQATSCVVEKAGTEDVDGKPYPLLRYPDIKPYLVPIK